MGFCPQSAVRAVTSLHAGSSAINIIHSSALVPLLFLNICSGYRISSYISFLIIIVKLTMLSYDENDPQNHSGLLCLQVKTAHMTAHRYQ